jgi:hypothetical protein
MRPGFPKRREPRLFLNQGIIKKTSYKKSTAKKENLEK